MSDSVGEMEREVAEARARLEGTIAAIQGRLTVTGLMDEAVDAMGQTHLRSEVVSAGLEGVWGLAKRYPLPILAVAAGLGWLVHSMRRDQRAALSVEPELPLLNVGQSRIYDPDASTRHPGQDSLESRRDLTAQA